MFCNHAFDRALDVFDVTNAEVHESVAEVTLVDHDAKWFVWVVFVPPHIDRVPRWQLDLQDVAQLVDVGWVV